MRAWLVLLLLMASGCLQPTGLDGPSTDPGDDAAEDDPPAPEVGSQRQHATVKVRFSESSTLAETTPLATTACTDAALADAPLSHMAALLPEERSSPTIAFDDRDCAEPGCPGGCAYILGGRDRHYADEPHTQDILRYNPQTGLLRKLDATLPRPIAAGAAVWLDGKAYLFGGSTHTFDGPGDEVSEGRPIKYIDEIVAFDAASGEATLLEDRLPTGRTRASAVVIGDAAYIFGGYPHTDQILRFTPEAGVEVLSATLPTARFKTSAFFDPRITEACPEGCAYILGGQDSGYLDEVVRFEPTTAQVAVLEHRMPAGRISFQSVWHEGAAYVIGGWDGGRLATIERFDPLEGTWTLEPAMLPSARSSFGTFSAGQAIMIVGGKLAGESRSREILAYAPTIGAVIDLDIPETAAPYVPALHLTVEDLEVVGDEAPVTGEVVVDEGEIVASLPSLPLDFGQPDLGLADVAASIQEWVVVDVRAGP